MKSKITIITILSMILISISTTLFSVLNIINTELYKLLFMLPLSFLFLIFVVIKCGAKYLYRRISILITIFFYFARNVIVPLFMVFGEYSTYVPDRYLNYMSIAVALCVYEIAVVSVLLAFQMRKLNIEEKVDVVINNNVISIKSKYSFKIKFIILFLILYIIYITYLDPTILRQTFMLMVGTPDGWYIRTDYRQLGTGGSGVLGIFATLVNTFFWIIQALVPAIMLTWVVKNKPKKSQIRWTFFIAFMVLMIVTGTRIHAVECAVSIILVALSIYDDELRKKLPVIAIIGVVLTLLNLMQKSGISMFNMPAMSKMVSSYFGGVQNVASSIYAAKNIGDMNLLLLPADILLKIPYLSSLFENVFESTSGMIFNLLIGDGTSSGQILPAIGQGYIYFGFILAPIIPCISIMASIKFECKARMSGNLIYKNIYYIAAIMMARVAPSTNMMSGIQYLFYTYLILFVVNLGMARIKKNNSNIKFSLS